MHTNIFGMGTAASFLDIHCSSAASGPVCAVEDDAEGDDEDDEDEESLTRVWKERCSIKFS